MFQDDGGAGVFVQPPLQRGPLRAAQATRAAEASGPAGQPGHLRKQQLQQRRQGEPEHVRHLVREHPRNVCQ